MMQTPSVRKTRKSSRSCSIGEVFWKPRMTAVRPLAAMRSMSAPEVAISTMSALSAMRRCQRPMVVDVSRASSQIAMVTCMAETSPLRQRSSSWRSPKGMHSASILTLSRCSAIAGSYRTASITCVSTRLREETRSCHRLPSTALPSSLCWLWCRMKCAVSARENLQHWS